MIRPAYRALVHSIPRPPLDVAVVAAAALGALIVALIVVQPLGRATNDPDSAASVVYFQHILGGRRLEAMVTTTPKPLLTAVFGLSWTLTGSWSVLIWETILVYVVAVALAVRLAIDLLLPAAAGFIIVSLVGWPDLLVEVAHANSLPWALAGWLLAAWAIHGRNQRSWLAGIALFLAGLARTETLWLVAAAGVWLIVAAARAGHHASPSDGANRRWDRVLEAVRPVLPVVVLGGLALPVMCIHDWLLTGQPFYWTGVPASYTAIIDSDLRPIGFREFVELDVLPHYAAMVPTLVLAGVGLVGLLASRRFVVAGGIAALVSGVAVTLALLADRGVFISPRYWEEADVAIRFGAAIGAGYLVQRSGRVLRSAIGREPVGASLRTPALVATGGLIALVVAWSVLAKVEIEGPLGITRTATAHLESVSGEFGAILAGATGGTVAARNVELPVIDPRAVRLFVPREDLNRVAAGTGTPVSALGDSFLAFRLPAKPYSLQPGQWVFHDVALDGRGGPYATLEVSRPTRIGQVVIDPLISDPTAGIWLDRTLVGPVSAAPRRPFRSGRSTEPG